MPPACSRTARASRSGGRARSSASTAPPSATGPIIPTPTRTCGPTSGTSPVVIPAGAIDGPMPCSVGRATTLNRKKVQRLWREEGLRVPPRRHKRRRLGLSTTPADRLSATHPDHVWALDYQFDVTSMGRTIKILHVTDEFTRESLSDLVAYSIDADATVAALDRARRPSGAPVPQFIRCDNGPELTAYALRDWCRFTGAGTSYIDPGSPWQNPWVESYGSRMRDELLAIEQFDSSSKPRFLSPTGKRSTTPTDHTRRSACSRRSSSPSGGGPPATAHIAGGPINGVRSKGRRHQSQPRIDFDRFVAETAQPLLRSAYLITWDFAEAEDLVQECLFKVARRWPRVKKMERPDARTPRTVLIHLALDEGKRRSQRRSELGPESDRIPRGAPRRCCRRRNRSDAA